MVNVILAGIIGFLIGLAVCYWKQIQTVYQNRDLIESGANVATDVQNFVGQLQKI